MGYRLQYITPWGRDWQMTQKEWVTGINAGGIDGLVGDSQDVTTESPLIPGQVLDSHNIGHMVGSLRVTIGPDGDTPAGKVWASFRSGFSRVMAGTLGMHSPQYGWLTTQVRLAKTLPPPDVEPNDEGIIDELGIQLVSDSGLWLHEPQAGAGAVTIANPGDALCFPRLRWSGAGGVVTVPSGATFTLPAVDEERIMLLSAAESMAIFTPRGDIDYPLMRQLRAALPEGVPPGQSRTWHLPAGVTAEWQIGVLDPWK